MRQRVLAPEVVDVAGGNERHLLSTGQLDEVRVDPLLHVETGVLQLDVDVVAPEDLGEPVELGLGVVRAILLQRLADSPRKTSGEDDQAFRVALEQLPIDARAVVVALQVAERGELDQIAIALVRGGQHGQVGVALFLHAAVVADVQLRADHRLDALLAGLAIELDRPGQRAVVGERHGGHLQFGRPRRQGRDPARSVQDRVLGMDVQMNERGAQGSVILGAVAASSESLGVYRRSRAVASPRRPARQRDLPLGHRAGNDAKQRLRIWTGDGFDLGEPGQRPGHGCRDIRGAVSRGA